MPLIWLVPHIKHLYNRTAAKNLHDFSDDCYEKVETRPKLNCLPRSDYDEKVKIGFERLFLCEATNMG